MVARAVLEGSAPATAVSVWLPRVGGAVYQ
jgi:hypothetical protein